MDVVAATHDLRIGGSQLYLLLVAEQLERLGHRVVLHAPESNGPLADLAVRRDVRLARSQDDLPATCDAILVQDAAMSHRLAAAYPRVAQVFRCPSELFDLQLPPQVPGQLSALVALSDRVAGRLRALAVPLEVTRLRHPIDTARFAGGESLRPRPRRALLIGNYLRGDRRDLLVEAWRGAGVECTVAGQWDELTTEPERAMADADIVVAKGRAALEGMSSGRAVYVYDEFGCDGWVTPARYPAMEADGFAGQATDALPSSEALRADLERYEPQMGMVNRDLVVRHHSPRRHAEALARLLAQAAPHAEAPSAPHLELARLAGRAARLEMDAFSLAYENKQLLARLRDTERAHAEADARTSADAERLAASVRAHEDELRSARRADRSRAHQAERELERITGARAYRAARALKRAIDPSRVRSASR